MKGECFIAEVSPTFKDLYDYIQTAERNVFGDHVPDVFRKIKESTGNTYSLHIYDTKRQVNICQIDENKNYNSIGNLYFTENEDNPESMDVVFFQIIGNNYCDYDHPTRLPIDTPIECQGTHTDIWPAYLGIKGRLVKELLRDLLCPIVR